MNDKDIFDRLSKCNTLVLASRLLLMYKALQLVRPDADYDDDDEWMQASAAHQHALNSFNDLVFGPDKTNLGG
jgi:hypothetical protein